MIWMVRGARFGTEPTMDGGQPRRGAGEVHNYVIYLDSMQFTVQFSSQANSSVQETVVT